MGTFAIRVPFGRRGEAWNESGNFTHPFRPESGFREPKTILFSGTRQVYGSGNSLPFSVGTGLRESKAMIFVHDSILPRNQKSASALPASNSGEWRFALTQFSRG